MIAMRSYGPLAYLRFKHLSLKSLSLWTTLLILILRLLNNRYSISLRFNFSSFLNLFLHIFRVRDGKSLEIIEKSVPNNSRPFKNLKVSSSDHFLVCSRARNDALFTLLVWLLRYIGGRGIGCYRLLLLLLLLIISLAFSNPDIVVVANEDDSCSISSSYDYNYCSLIACNLLCFLLVFVFLAFSVIWFVSLAYWVLLIQFVSSSAT